MILFMAFIDIIGIASIMPFMAVLASPEAVNDNNLLSAIKDYIKPQNPDEFLYILGILVFLILVFSQLFKALTTYIQFRFCLNRQHSIGKKLIEKYLHQPYSWFINQHGSDLGKNILAEVANIIWMSILPMMNIFAHGSVIIAILLLLTAVDYVIASTVGLSIGLIYFLIFFSVKKYLNFSSSRRFKLNSDRFKALNNAFGSIKFLKVTNLEKPYIKNFSSPSKEYSVLEANTHIVGLLPRFLVEIIAFGGMLGLIILMMDDKQKLEQTLPLITLYAFSAYRLLPSIQQVYLALTQLKSSQDALDKLYRDLQDLNSEPSSSNLSKEIIFSEKLDMINVSFRYPGNKKEVLKDFSLSIPINSIIGFVGSSGSGKSTIVDILLGLLQPSRGRVEVDGIELNNENVKSWQKLLGYVPQQFFLSDTSIMENIALGVKKEEINFNYVIEATKAVNLHDFIINELPDGYETIIGEGGVKLSGGQRQRVAIARSLYRKPKVLILDEATSSLDNISEASFMKEITDRNKKLTVIIIAHRLNTVRNCKKIYLIDNGIIRSQGSYDSLIKKDEYFRKLSLI